MEMEYGGSIGHEDNDSTPVTSSHCYFQDNNVRIKAWSSLLLIAAAVELLSVLDGDLRIYIYLTLVLVSASHSGL